MSQTTAVPVQEVQKHPVEVFGGRMRAEYRGLLETHYQDYCDAMRREGRSYSPEGYSNFMLAVAYVVMGNLPPAHN
jgi:hypothetical protein